MDPDYKAPYTDQFIVSLERELARSLGAQLNYVHKRGRTFAGWQDIAGEYVQVPFVDEAWAPWTTHRAAPSSCSSS